MCHLFVAAELYISSLESRFNTSLPKMSLTQVSLPDIDWPGWGWSAGECHIGEILLKFRSDSLEEYA